MTTDYRTSKVGADSEKASQAEISKTIEGLENALKAQAESLRRTRQDYVNGMLKESEFAQVEEKFSKMLVEQRKELQLLRRAMLK
jgi:hypothetical protein